MLKVMVKYISMFKTDFFFWLFGHTVKPRLFESFRIISSSNDRNQKFSDIFGKAQMLSQKVIVLPESLTSTPVFREVIGTSVKALKKISCIVVSYALQV